MFVFEIIDELEIFLSINRGIPWADPSFGQRKEAKRAIEHMLKLIIEAFETGLYHLTGYTIQTLYTGVNLCLCGFRGKPCFL